MDQKPCMAHTKAGILLYGWVAGADGFRRLHVIMPYTEGRFSDDGRKFYSPIKGGIDEADASPQAAAVRELREETGLSLVGLTGPRIAGQFLRGEPIALPPQGMLSPHYNGVRVKHIDAMPVAEHEYVSGHGRRKSAAYYAIEVENIEALDKHLKGYSPNESAASEYTHLRAATRRRTNPDLPELGDMLHMLRSGAGAAPGTQSCFPALEKNWCEANGHQDFISNLDSWLRFCTEVPGRDFKKLEQEFERIAEQFEVRGIISDQGDSMKMDCRDRPLIFFHERAERLTLEEAVRRMQRLAKQYPIYAPAIFGEYQGPRRQPVSDAEQMREAQLAPFMQFFGRIAPMELAASITNLSSNRFEDADRSHFEIDRRGKLLVQQFADPAVSDPSWQQKILEEARARQQDDPLLSTTAARL